MQECKLDETTATTYNKMYDTVDNLDITPEDKGNKKTLFALRLYKKFISPNYNHFDEKELQAHLNGLKFKSEIIKEVLAIHNSVDNEESGEVTAGNDNSTAQAQLSIGGSVIGVVCFVVCNGR